MFNLEMGSIGPGKASRSITIISIIIFITINLAGGTDAQEKEELDIIYYSNSPFIYKTGENQVGGIAVDIISPLLEDKGYGLVYREIQLNTFSGELEEGGGDLLLGCNIQKDIEENITFSEESIYSNWGILYSNKEFKVSTILDLHKSWIGVVKDDIYYNGANGLEHLLISFGIEPFIVEFGNYQEVVESIEDGDVDVGLLNAALGMRLENDRDIKRTSVIFSPIDIGMAVNQEKIEMVDLLNDLDKDIGRMKDDPDSNYYTTLDRYLENENKRPEKVVIPGWLLRTTLILLASVVLLCGIALFLRGKVRSRTRELENTNLMLQNDITKREKVELELTDEKNRSVFYLDLLIHDIGNIHQGLLSHIQLHELLKGDHEKGERNIKQMADLMQRSQVLVRNVNKFTEAVGPERKLEPVDIKPVIIDSLRTAVLSTPQIDIETETDLLEGEIMVNCGPLIEDLFYNLFHNAVKFHDGPKGKIEVSVREEDNGKWYGIMISDHGRGIPDHMKETIFSRLERSTERKHRGMGLTLVKVLVRRYGGTIEVDDRVSGDHSKGAIFKLRLPVLDERSTS